MSMSFFTDELAEVKTHKKDFLGQMNQLIPWSEWVAMIKPCYYKGERGNKPYDLELMLRIYVLQMVYNVADMAVAAEVIDSQALSEFCGVTSSNQVPNGDTIGRFRNILIQNRLQEKLFADIVSRLKARGLMLMKGTIVASTLIAAPSSTKNEKKERDPDAHQVKKGNQWYFGYKGHIAVDRDTGLVRKIETTAANVHDVTQVAGLMDGTEKELYGNSGYLGAEKREEAILTNNQGKEIQYIICARPSSLKKRYTGTEYEKAAAAEHAKASIRCKVEHVFAVVKGMFRFRKTRLRGLTKVNAQLHMLFALANLILVARPSLAV